MLTSCFTNNRSHQIRASVFDVVNIGLNIRSTRIDKAIEFAKDKHAGQTRRGTDLPYVSHPIAVATIVATYKQSKQIEELIIASLLHDTLEDTDTTYEELRNTFSPLIASLVHELTNDVDQMKQVGKLSYQKRKMQHMSSWGLVIKLADRLHNVSDTPTKKMISDTLQLVRHLEHIRPLSLTQHTIAQQIKDICNSH